MAKVLVTAIIDVPCVGGSVRVQYLPSPEPVTAPDDHIEFIVKAGRGTRVSSRGDTVKGIAARRRPGSEALTGEGA